MTCLAVENSREERALDDVPVALQPRPDEFGAAGSLEPAHVAGIGGEQGGVVGEFGRDEDTRETGIRGRSWDVGPDVDGPCLDPVVAGPAGVAGGPELAACTPAFERSVAKSLKMPSGSRTGSAPRHRRG